MQLEDQSKCCAHEPDARNTDSRQLVARTRHRLEVDPCHDGFQSRTSPFNFFVHLIPAPKLLLASVWEVQEENFDEYADEFEDHLVNTLEYNLPEAVFMLTAT